MTRLGLATLIRKKTRTNSTTYGDTEMLVDVNLMKDEMAGKISAQRNEAFNIEKLENLVADTRAYEYDDNVMNNLARVEVQFVASGDFVVLDFLKHHNYREGTQETEIVAAYDNIDPKAFVRGKFLHILSGTIVAITNGIRWIYKEFPADLADLTDNSTQLHAWANNTTPGFPREFHELLARSVSIEWKERNNRKMSQRDLRFEIDFQEAIGNYMIVSTDEEILGKLPPASEVGDDGFNY